MSQLQFVVVNIYNVKWPFKVIQGHVFWGHKKGDKGLNNNI